MRKQIRSALRDLIAAALPNATVWKYRKADPKGVSPVIMVCSGGTSRPRATLKGSFGSHAIRIYSLVLHSDATVVPAWTEEQAEDLLDDHEEAISTVVDLNQKSQYWGSIEYEQMSEAARVELGGVPYLLEVMVLTVRELR